MLRLRLADGRLCGRERPPLRALRAAWVPGGGGGSFTPARRALERPMAIACFAERAPCFPSRTWRICSRTNSPACVLGDLPSRAFRRARSTVRFSGMRSPSASGGLFAVELSKLPLRALEDVLLRLRHPLPRAVDVEIEHRHRRAERRALASSAALGRAL